MTIFRTALILLLGFVLMALPLFCQASLPEGSSYLGDVDDNGEIDIFDLLEELRILKTGETDNARQRQLADSNRDGKINIFDLLEILKFISGRDEPGIITWGPPSLEGIEPLNVTPGDTVTILLSGLGTRLGLEDFVVRIDSLPMVLTEYSYGRLGVSVPEDYRGGMAMVIAGADTVGSIYINVLNENPPVIAGVQIFPADNPWNQSVEKLPVHEKSETWIYNAGRYASLHPDFGSNLNYGIPYTTVDGSRPRVPLSFTYYDESDPGPYPIPPDAPIEGGDDRHILVLDTTSHKLYETWFTYPEGDGWSAGSGAIFDLTSNAIRPEYWTSADAAGLPILPGLIRYEEILAGEITHAVRFTVPESERAFIYPATHYASPNTDGLYMPMGARVRLKADYDISGFSGAAKIILEAFKKYGLIMADNGVAWFFQGVSDTRWDDDNLNTLKTVPGSAFEVVDTSPMLVSGKEQRLKIRPGGKITGPVPESSFSAPATIAVTAEAYDYDGTVVLVEFLVDGEKLGEDAAAPYELEWTDVAAGSYELAVRVTDNDGVSNTSYRSTVTVESPLIY